MAIAKTIQGFVSALVIISGMVFLRLLGSSVLLATAMAGPLDRTPQQPDFLPASQSPINLGQISDSVLPLIIPGYQLRVLDLRKPVVLKLGGEQIEASLPIFFYTPTADRIHAATAVRRVHDELQALGRKSEWTAAEFQSLIAKLEAALQLLEMEAKAEAAER